MFTRFKKICYDLEIKYAKRKIFTIAEKFPKEKFAKFLNRINYSAAPLVHKTGNFIIYSETTRSELIDNKSNFGIT